MSESKALRISPHSMNQAPDHLRSLSSSHMVCTSTSIRRTFEAASAAMIRRSWGMVGETPSW